MARIVIKKDHGPKQCAACLPISHIVMGRIKTLDEGDQTYFYPEQGSRLTVKEIRTQEAVCACGHDGQCANCKHK